MTNIEISDPKPVCTTEQMEHSEGMEHSGLTFNYFEDGEYAQLNFEPLFRIMAL